MEREVLVSAVKVGQRIAVTTPSVRIFGEVVDLGEKVITIRGESSKYTKGEFFLNYGQIQSFVIPADGEGTGTLA